MQACVHVMHARRVIIIIIIICSWPSECVVAKQAQQWPLGSRVCGTVSQGYTAIRHARQNGVMHILGTFH